MTFLIENYDSDLAVPKTSYKQRGQTNPKISA